MICFLELVGLQLHGRNGKIPPPNPRRPNEEEEVQASNKKASLFRILCWTLYLVVFYLWCLEACQSEALEAPQGGGIVNDADKFLEFFKGMGIHGEVDPQEESKFWPKETAYTLGVSQAWFCFDKDKNYIGVLADDTGYFSPREAE